MGIMARLRGTHENHEIEGSDHALHVKEQRGREDAFQREVVAFPYTIGDYIFKFDLLPDFFDAVADANGNGSAITHLPNESSVQMDIGSVSGDFVQLCTRRYHRYQSGLSAEIMLTAVIGDAITNITKRWGYFDSENGLFFRQDSDGTFNVCKRTFTSGAMVETEVAQANFNIDMLDGNGVSGFNIDLAKTQIFAMQFQWLGVGAVTFFVAGENGAYIPCHRFSHANMTTEVYMTTAYLPVNYRMDAIGANTGGNMKAICSTVKISGGQPPPEYPFEEGAELLNLGINVETAVIAFSPNDLYNSITNRMIAYMKHIVFSSAGENIRWRAYKVNSRSAITLGAGGWVEAQLTGMEYNINPLTFNKTTLYNAVKMLDHKTYGSKSDAAASDTNVRSFGITRTANNTDADMIILTAERTSGQATDVFMGMYWAEIR